MEAAERKLATVLFADLVGSTALGEEPFENLGLEWHAAETRRLVLEA